MEINEFVKLIQPTVNLNIIELFDDTHKLLCSCLARQVYFTSRDYGYKVITFTIESKNKINIYVKKVD